MPDEERPPHRLTPSPDGSPRDFSRDTALEIEHLFGDQRPFLQCHASTIVALEDGSTLAAWFAGTREGHPDVAIWAARRERVAAVAKEKKLDAHLGTRWSPPIRIAKISEEAHWNPVLFSLSQSGESSTPRSKAADGRDLVLHFKVGDRIRRWVTWSQRSHDGGRTWEEARPLVSNRSAARGGHGAVRNKPIRLSSGDWIAGASLERWRRWDAFFDRSPDGESGWTATPLIEIDRRNFKGKGIIQPTLWESSPTRVHAFFRSTDGRVQRADSEDDGQTWSAARPTLLPNNNSGLDLARLPDGTLALACNPVPGNWAPRTPLSVLFSRDNGETWPGRIDVESDPGEFSYPAIITDGNDLALGYTWNRRRIAFVQIPRARIEMAFAVEHSPDPSSTRG